MIRNEVTIYNDRVAKVSKGLNSVFVVWCGLVVSVVHEDSNTLESPYILEVGTLHDTGQATNEWKYVIGRMCREKASSEFFNAWKSRPNLAEDPKVKSIDAGELPTAIASYIKVAIGDAGREHGVSKPSASHDLLRKVTDNYYDYVLPHLPNGWQDMSEDKLRVHARNIMSEIVKKMNDQIFDMDCITRNRPVLASGDPIDPEILIHSIAGEDYKYVMQYLPNSWQLMDMDLLQKTVSEILADKK